MSDEPSTVAPEPGAPSTVAPEPGAPSTSEPGTGAAEPPEVRARRLRHRSWRRGMRETDLLLGAFADAEIERLSPEELDDYESLLLENDQDLYLWISRKRGQPSRLDAIVRRIAAFHRIA